MQKTIYEPHPITAARKAELKASGYRIIDARYKPDDYDDGNITEFIPDTDKTIIHGGTGGDKIDLGKDSGDQFSDAQLRDIIGEVTGTKPSNAAKRENLIKRFNDINAEQPELVAEAIVKTAE